MHDGQEHRGEKKERIDSKKRDEAKTRRLGVWAFWISLLNVVWSGWNTYSKDQEAARVEKAKALLSCKRAFFLGADAFAVSQSIAEIVQLNPGTSARKKVATADFESQFVVIESLSKQLALEINYRSLILGKLEKTDYRNADSLYNAYKVLGDLVAVNDGDEPARCLQAGAMLSVCHHCLTMLKGQYGEFFNRGMTKGLNALATNLLPKSLKTNADHLLFDYEAKPFTSLTANDVHRLDNQITALEEAMKDYFRSADKEG